MSKRKVMVSVVEDPKRRLLGTCSHRAPACWACVADDMERQRDAAEARAERAEGERDAACRMADDNAQIVRVATDERDRAEARVAMLEGALRRVLHVGSQDAASQEWLDAAESARAALASASLARLDRASRREGR
jgi:hypothetical protein